jgi:hypothetical protein
MESLNLQYPEVGEAHLKSLLEAKKLFYEKNAGITKKKKIFGCRLGETLRRCRFSVLSYQRFAVVNNSRACRLFCFINQILTIDFAAMLDADD